MSWERDAGTILRLQQELRSMSPESRRAQLAMYLRQAGTLMDACAESMREHERDHSEDHSEDIFDALDCMCIDAYRYARAVQSGHEWTEE